MLTAHYDWKLVKLSIVIAVSASYVAIGMHAMHLAAHQGEPLRLTGLASLAWRSD
jgi:NO-binding membrane sensor protein with MHYT domain